MDKDLISLSDLFNRSIFRVPDYQRGYAWESKEVEDFWGDLEMLSNDRLHYGGVLTLEEVEENTYKTWSNDQWLFDKRNIKPYYIVDGQQRLTTAMILLSVIVNIIKEKFPDEYLDENMTIQEIEKKFMFESNNKGLNHTFLFSYERDNDSYYYYVTEILKKDNVTNISNNEIINKYNNNLKFAYEYFNNKCRNMSFIELDKLYCKLVYKFVFNRYVIDSQLDIFVTFETMNNRGKNLSQLELLKNRLIYLTTLYQIDNGTKIEMRNKINICWKKIYKILGQLSPNKIDTIPKFSYYYKEVTLNLDDIFLNAQLSAYPKENIKDILNKDEHEIELSLNTILKEIFTANNVVNNTLTINEISNYIDDLSKSITIWSAMKFPQISNYSEEFQEYLLKINYLSNLNNFMYYKYYYMGNVNSLIRNKFSMDVFIESFIFKLLKSEQDDEALKILKSLEKIMFINSFLPSNINDKVLEEERSQIVEKFYECLVDGYQLSSLTKDDLITINRKLNSIRLSLANIPGKASSYYKNRLAYNDYKKVAYYILIEYEIYLMKKSENNIEFSNIEKLYYDTDKYNLEHIYPKNGRNPYWHKRFSKLNNIQKDKYKNTLGNLIVISSKKNEGLGNKDYPTKIDPKIPNKPLGYKYGGYAEKYLIENYEEWNPKNIELRGKEIFEFIKSKWNLSLSKKEVNNILNIE